ncbi:hypothetical protein IPH92_02590 [Candidatus Kaiserbacteria bacterium]|nr:MAG: hypothetical protein IPH92_02590 [Candidatus Kaiserbacteria bacterium]
MRLGLFLVLYMFFAPQALAYVPVLVEQESLNDITQIADPTLAQGFFGTLDSFPQTYEIHASEPFTLYANIRTPDLPSNTNTVSGIIIKEEKRGVSEITRMHAADAAWETVHDTLTGNSYREGATFEKELEPGVYRIEVHTPDNAEKYVLMVGKRDDMTLGYFSLLGRLIDVQRFNERSAFFMVLSPYVYIPLGIIMGGIGGVWWYKRRPKVQK